MQKEMRILRNMNENDVKEIADLESKTFTDAWSENSVYDTFCQKQAFIVVAEQDEKMIGYCISYFVLDEGEIARIAVDVSWRRQGVGREILEQVEKICAEKDITKLLLDVRESNVAARKFYARYGFCEDGVRKDFYDKPKENAVLMSKAITTGNSNKD